jgi:hypothetical protein
VTVKETLITAVAYFIFWPLFAFLFLIFGMDMLMEKAGELEVRKYIRKKGEGYEKESSED